jgi:NADP-dependent 3-hydroxy acid dehydrogenase YdfG
MSKRLSGKVAVVTGASSGIGEATAFALAGEGAKVAIVARRAHRLDSLEKRIAEAGGEALKVVADVSTAENAETSIKAALAKWGHVDILINNAGIMLLGPVTGADAADFKRMFDINVMGLMYCTHAALPGMKERKSGHIVNISSVSGRQVSARSAVYSATKFAVGAFSDGLRQEVHKDNIRVTIIEPGAVATELTDHITHSATKDAVKSWVDNMTPLTSEDIAAAIVYAVTQGEHVNVNEILIRPTQQP